jgi:hypothetical protein
MDMTAFIASLRDHVDAVGVVTLLWIAEEVFRTLYAWSPLATRQLAHVPEHEAIESMVGLSQELEEARRHRKVELAILGAIAALQVPVWIAVARDLVLLRWFGVAVSAASLLLVASRRRTAYRRVLDAHGRTIRLLDQALALKAKRGEGQGDS